MVVQCAKCGIKMGPYPNMAPVIHVGCGGFLNDIIDEDGHDD